MRITVLGKSPAWQDAGGACSGYLVEEDDGCVLLECGNGVFSKLRATRDYLDVDAVVISHMHADHFLDLVPFAYALTYSQRPRGTEGKAAGGRPRLGPLAAACWRIACGPAVARRRGPAAPDERGRATAGRHPDAAGADRSRGIPAVHRGRPVVRTD